jgi:hypothetical protein
LKFVFASKHGVCQFFTQAHPANGTGIFDETFCAITLSFVKSAPLTAETLLP